MANAFNLVLDDIHIIGSFSIVSFAYKHFQTKLRAIGFLSNLKYVLHGHPLACHQTLTPHPSLPPHLKELESWGFCWAP